MSRQFSQVDSSRGAPMGRYEYGLIQNCEPRAVSLFAVQLDDGGYDDGGAYWGISSAGRRLYCATDGDEYRRFVRAASRCHAALLLDIEQKQLKQGLQRLAFGRYSAQLGHFGRAAPGYEICEFGQVLMHVDDWHALCHFAQSKERS